MRTKSNLHVLHTEQAQKNTQIYKLDHVIPHSMKLNI